MSTVKISWFTAFPSGKLISKWFATPIRYDIPRGEAQPLRVRSDYQWLRVISGVAWVSYAADAAVLRDGEALQLTHKMGEIVISAEKGLPLSFEILRGDD
ncbi:MAG: hypothetical protein KF726_12850 [Anaerolineae bacterium]|nr:hypothetical protein [Anaerolineae bacterium]